MHLTKFLVIHNQTSFNTIVVIKSVQPVVASSLSLLYIRSIQTSSSYSYSLASNVILPCVTQVMCLLQPQTQGGHNTPHPQVPFSTSAGSITTIIFTLKLTNISTSSSKAISRMVRDQFISITIVHAF